MSVFRQPFGRGQFQLGSKSKPRKAKPPAVYDAKVDPSKVNLPALKAWGRRRLVELMGTEDEIAQALVQDVLDSSKPDPLQLESGLAGLMDDAVRAKFVEDLWKLMVAAQEAPNGTPSELKDLETTDVVAEDALAAAERAKAAALAAAARLQEQLSGMKGGTAAVGPAGTVAISMSEHREEGKLSGEEDVKQLRRSQTRSRSPQGQGAVPRRPHSPNGRSSTGWRAHSPDRARYLRRHRSPQRERERDREREHYRYARSHRDRRDEEGRRGRRERERRVGRHRTRNLPSPSPSPTRFTPPPETLGERHSHERRPRHWEHRSGRRGSVERGSMSSSPIARRSRSS